MSSNRTYSNFGSAVSQSLAARQLNQVDLAQATGTSVSYTNQTITGHKRASARWADLVADALQMSSSERQTIHEAAAKDHGFKLDLTE